MRTGILLTILCCTLIFVSSPAQQMPYSGKRHSSSRGGYNQHVKGYSHKGGLFRKAAAEKVVKKKKPLSI